MTRGRSLRVGGGDVRYIASPSEGLLKIGAIFGFASFWYVVSAVSYEPLPLWSQIAIAGPLGPITMLFIAAASDQTFLCGETVYVVSTMVTRLLPANEVVGIDAEKGMALLLVSGRRIPVVRRGIALMSIITTGQRARRAASQLQQLLGPLDPEAGPRHDDTTVTILRWRVLLFAIALIATMVWLGGLGPFTAGGD
jgi:hypothetical protein